MSKQSAADISNRIGAALERDPRVNLHHSPVTVGTANNRVCLEGRMESIAEKRAAVDAATRVLFTQKDWTLEDRLHVHPTERKEDLELQELVESALGNEPAFRDYTLVAEAMDKRETIHDAGSADRSITASIHEGAITLTGRVESLTHSRLAEVLMWWTSGCSFVQNMLEIVPPEEDNDDELNDAVRIVLEKDPLVHADQLSVATAGGVVVMNGAVATTQEKRFAVLDAWCVPGVSDVVDRIEALD
ncbi:MAG TPA: BON domain-containing protein [Arenicellales bacterium]|nr:BON domain-containing protein [Arenicellales bacterium]